MVLLNSSFNEPLYKQLQNLIIEKIENREYLPGEKLPGTRKLAEKYGLNRLTVHKAIDNLAVIGILKKVPSSGTFVSDTYKSNNLNLIQSNIGLEFSNSGLYSILMNKGATIQNKVLATDTFSNIPYFSSKLDLDLSEEIFGMHRLRLIQNRPFALEYNYLPKSIFSDIDNIDFRYVGLYDYIRSRNNIIRNNEIRTVIIPASKKEAKLLEIKEGKYIYRMQYITNNDKGEIIEYTESFLLPEEVHPKFKVEYQ